MIIGLSVQLGSASLSHPVSVSPCLELSLLLVSLSHPFGLQFLTFWGLFSLGRRSAGQHLGRRSAAGPMWNEEYTLLAGTYFNNYSWHKRLSHLLLDRRLTSVITDNCSPEANELDIIKILALLMMPCIEKFSSIWCRCPKFMEPKIGMFFSFRPALVLWITRRVSIIEMQVGSDY